MRAIFRKHFRWFSSKLQGDAVDSFAAQVAFFIMIAFIPFVLFLLSLLQSVNMNGTSLLQAALNLFPKEVRRVLTAVFFEQREPIALLSVAAFTCLWSSSKAMVALIKGLDAVFDVPETRGFLWLRVVSVGYTVVFALILALTAMVLVFGNTLYLAILGDSGIGATFLQNKSLVGFLLLFVFFTFSYRVIPRKSKTKLFYCAFGGAFAAAGWVLYSFFFSVFVENFSNYAGIYGSLASLVILMLWLFFCMYLVFLGGEVAVWLRTSGIAKDLFGLWRGRQNRPKTLATRSGKKK